LFVLPRTYFSFADSRHHFPFTFSPSLTSCLIAASA
jgi:hypothetical protein